MAEHRGDGGESSRAAAPWKNSEAATRASTRCGAMRARSASRARTAATWASR
ncbi:hypothetical protein ACFQXA_04440 [Nocardiopsis composta]